MMNRRGVVGMFYLVLAAVVTLAISILIMNWMYNRAASMGRTADDQGVRGRVIALCTKLRDGSTGEVSETIEFPAKVENTELARYVVAYCFPGVDPGDIAVTMDCHGEAQGHVLHWCGDAVLLGTKKLSVQATSDEEYDITLRVRS